MAKSTVRKLFGPTLWLEVSEMYDGKITRAFMHNDNRLEIEIEDKDAIASLVVLERERGDLFTGDWTCHWEGDTYGGAVKGHLYTSSEGYFFFGDWHEDGVSYPWWVKLSHVDRFPDES